MPMTLTYKPSLIIILNKLIKIARIMNKKVSAPQQLKMPSRERIDIKEMQRNVKEMRRQMDNVLRMQKQIVVPRSELPSISESKLIKCCVLASPRRTAKVHQAIDRILRAGVERFQSLDRDQHKSVESLENLENSLSKQTKRFQGSKNQIKLKNSLKRIRRQMNLNKSQQISIQGSKKLLKRQEIIHSLKEKDSSLNENMNGDKVKQLTIEKIKKKNSKNRRRHQAKFTNVLDLINRKIQNQQPSHLSPTLQRKTLQPKSSRPRNRSRYYSESHDENLSRIEHGLMENRYMSVVMDSNLSMLKKEEEINKTFINKRKNGRGREGDGEREGEGEVNRYVDLSKYVLVFDKNRYRMKRSKQQLRASPVIAKEEGNTRNIMMESVYSPWDLNEEHYEADFEQSMKATIQPTSSIF